MYHHVSPYVGELQAERGRRCASPGLEDLMRRAAARDERAWASLVSRFTPRIRAIARAHRLNPHDAEDVVQTTWLQVFKHIRSVRDPEKLGAYVHTTARRLSINTAMASRRDPVVDPAGAPEPATPCEAERRLLAGERTAAIATAVDALPPRQAALVRMLLTDPEPSYAELAVALDMPHGSIGPTRARCLARLAADPRVMACAAPGEHD